MTPSVADRVREALARVHDPEIHRPVTELGMVASVDVSPAGAVRVGLLLTVSGCPLRETLRGDVVREVAAVPGVTGVEVDFGVMSEEQRRTLQQRLMGERGARVIPFAAPGSTTQVYAVASGKGGVGKSSVTVNLAAATARTGRTVGVLDADVYGHSVPRMLGVRGLPTQVEQMIMPPTAYGLRVMSVGMFTAGNSPVVWRGPMLHRALEQFLADVYWGDLDVLFLDLPPGTGDIALSVAHLIPSAQLVVVTTPQQAAAEVAERAGAVAAQTQQRIAGVVENMAWLGCPHCGERAEVFGAGGGASVAERLSRLLGAHVPLLGRIPLDAELRKSGDAGEPLVLASPDAPAARELRDVAARLAARGRGLAGRRLKLTPR
ncbi:Mrp/NBP35 family ATP-binding protein [Streptomyces sp. NPDC051940]|uniref:Mrp/NBP35 family ATP-binding protein n=1 Tax=Streptomyces sp. NPDC051940 TaxID=3155675 RepID=UPI00341FD4CB